MHRCSVSSVGGSIDVRPDVPPRVVDRWCPGTELRNGIARDCRAARHLEIFADDLFNLCDISGKDIALFPAPKYFRTARVHVMEMQRVLHELCKHRDIMNPQLSVIKNGNGLATPLKI